jgi:hypothetical protein
LRTVVDGLSTNPTGVSSSSRMFAIFCLLLLSEQKMPLGEHSILSIT